MKTLTLLKLIGCLALPLLMGMIAELATVQGINGWYETIVKPDFNPPNYLFGPVWTILYLLMGLGLFLVISKPVGRDKKRAVWAFCIQLLFNFCWSFLFFHFHQIGFALIDIVLIWVSVGVMMIFFYRVSRTAALLQIPYLLWVSFATVLNGAIYYLNQ